MMQSYIRFADRLSAWFGKVFAWSVIVMMVGVCYEVVVRYAFRAPTPWAFDLSYMMYGTLFMMAGAYTLSRDGHVRGDFIYRLWKPQNQARLELVLYFIFFFPAMLALVFAGWRYAARSFRYLEVSQMSPADIPIYQFKAVVVAAGILLVIQGVAQVFRCIRCMRLGYWEHGKDEIEELEKVLMEKKSLDALEVEEGHQPPANRDGRSA
jgi:TRAP-type mannitol/chloroaromatic compound transport system permease small subunit